MMSVLSLLLPAIIEILKRVIPDPDKIAEAQRSIEELLIQNQGKVFEAMQAVMVADSSSGDKFTSRARPTIVYWSVIMITLICSLGIFGAAGPVLDALNMVPESLWNLMTYGIGAYVLGRTGEKIAGDYFKSR